MSLILYQVGNVVLFNKLRGVNGSEVSIDLSRKWASNSLQLIGASGSVIATDPLRPVSNPTSLSVKGTLVTDEFDTAQQTFNRLNALGGFQGVPIIALQYNENLSDCGNCPPELTWLLSYGLLSSVKIESEYLTSGVSDHNTIEVDLDIDIEYFWRPLNKFIWEYRKKEISNPLEVETDGYISPFLHPIKVSGIKQDYFFYQWQNEDTLFDPSFWGDYFTEGQNGGNSSSWVTGANTTTLYVDPSFWNVPPISLYAFTNITVSGSIVIEVERPNLFFSSSKSSKYLATLDILQLNSDLIQRGYAGITPSDIIITGLIKPFPGFIRRFHEPTNSWTQLQDVRPKWIYEGLYPGETSVGTNIVNIYFDGSLGDLAYIHTYGVY